MQFILLRADFSHERGQQSSLDLWITGPAPPTNAVHTRLTAPMIQSEYRSSLCSTPRIPETQSTFVHTVLRDTVQYKVPLRPLTSTGPTDRFNRSWKENLCGTKTPKRFNTVFEDFLRRGREHQPSLVIQYLGKSVRRRLRNGMFWIHRICPYFQKSISFWFYYEISFREVL